VHRLSSLAVLLVVLPLGIAASCKGRRRHGVLLLTLLAAELALGLRMTGGVSLALALAHNVVAALLLATAFDLTRGPGATRSP
jgi:heme A synthase